ncbi:MAG: D-alanine--D-alanine ligase, partial [Candidatus Omnitrophica bacterium]|nr:D-alanine--D-alanine ligase [Candidatus Omnitrophota bacterium]
LQTDPADERQAEFDPPRTLDALEAALQQLGHDVARLGGVAHLLALPQRLRAVDLVWNLAEGDGGRCREAWVPTLLEHHGVPYVGSGPDALALGLDKALSKQLALASGLATPRWTVARDADDAAALEVPAYPVIVKPCFEGSGIGIDPGAVVHDPAALRARVAWLVRRVGGPCLIEAFVPFGELTVLVIGNKPAQALPAIQRPMDPATRLSCHVARQPDGSAWISPVELTPRLERVAGQAALAMFEALRCRDMARVDFRVDETGGLWFLEINPLPSLDPQGTVGLLAEHLGTTYAGLIERILNAALHRLAHAPVPQL